jgi:hypothetical protein
MPPIRRPMKGSSENIRNCFRITGNALFAPGLPEQSFALIPAPRRQEPASHSIEADPVEGTGGQAGCRKAGSAARPRCRNPLLSESCLPQGLRTISSSEYVGMPSPAKVFACVQEDLCLSTGDAYFVECEGLKESSRIDLYVRYHACPVWCTSLPSPLIDIETLYTIKF